MPTIQLPDGHSAELRDDDVRRSDVRAVAQVRDKEMRLSASSRDGEQMEAAGLMMSIATAQDVVLARFIKSWTLTGDDGRPLPVTLEVIQDLPLKYYKPIAHALTPVLVEVIQGEQESENGQPDPLSVARLSSSASTE